MDHWLTRSAPAILVGALFFAWPIVFNGYPIVFSDTGAWLDMGLLPSMGWDKPFLYGPVVAVLSLHRSLIAAAAAQTLLLSYMLWATQSAVAAPRAMRHLALCLTLAVATSAPWFASTLLPDAFTALVALGILTAAGRLPRRHVIPVAFLTAAAIASHLSHLILAAALIAVIMLLRRRVAWRPLGSLAAALIFLLTTNFFGNGRLAVSPYGSVFALARLIGDGPARDYLAKTCPDPTLVLCAWREQLTADSDQFLWDPASPFWSDPLPLADFATQASRIVAGTIRTEPGPVLRHAYRNATHELVRVDLGDTLVPDFLADTVRPRIARWFPDAELARFDTSRQVTGTLAPLAAQLLPLQRTVIILGLAGCAFLLIASLHRSHPSLRADIAALILIALAANAIATGALSAVHDRYEARLIWIILLPFLFRFSPLAAPAPHSPAPEPP